MSTKIEGVNGVWRTIGGRRVFIKDGQDLASAMKESGKFKGKVKKTVTDTYKEKVDESKLTDKEWLDRQSEKTRLLDDINDKYGLISDKEFDRLYGMSLEELKETAKNEYPDSYKEKSETHKKLEKEMGEELVEHTNDQGKKWYSPKSLDDNEQESIKRLENIINEDKKTGNTENRMKAIAKQQKYDKQYEEYENRGYTEKEIKDKLGERPKTGLETEERHYKQEHIDAYNKEKAKEKITSDEYNKKLNDEYNNLKSGKIDTEEYFKRTDDIQNKYTTDKILKGNLPENRQKELDKEYKELSTNLRKNTQDLINRTASAKSIEDLDNIARDIQYTPDVNNDIYYSTMIKIADGKSVREISKGLQEDLKENYNSTQKQWIKDYNQQPKGNSQINNSIRQKAYQKYLKEHPNSKITFEDFKDMRK